MSKYNFKDIHVVPTGMELIDIVLSRTQRKTPTVVRQRYQISRIRKFYMRKVKFAQQNFRDRISTILEDFPRLDDIHPFYGDLINVLYDRDHYKLALGQLNIARHLIDNLGKDYVKLLKYADALYGCKQLKRAALGRMCTLMKKQQASLAYLEQVRQHLSRLPSIDPSTRTLLVTGYPNVGKSSFMNKVSRANVDVQPYAFTTKSLFVGHMDYKYLRWQVIDTPGILDHPLEDRNTIEMQAITALAHLHSCVLFFIDISPHCEYSIETQANLFKSIEPLFSNKPLVMVANKCDLRKLSELDESDQAILSTISKEKNIPIVEMSNLTENGVIQVRNTACDILLEHRVQAKLLGKKIELVKNRIHVARPVKRDNKARPVHIPQSVMAKRAGIAMETDRTTTKDLEVQNGGAGVYWFNNREHWILRNPEWIDDDMPEIYKGQNVSDYIDPDIEARLAALELEEEKIAETEENEMKTEDSEDDYLDEDEQLLHNAVVHKKNQIILQSRHKHSGNKPGFPRKTLPRTMSKLEQHLNELGINTDKLSDRARSLSRKRDASRVGRKRQRSQGREDTEMRDVSKKKKKRKPSLGRNTGFKDVKQKLKGEKLAIKSQKKMNLDGRNETDRRIYAKMPKHLFTGKRGIGKTDWR